MLPKLLAGLLAASLCMEAAADPGYYLVTPYAQAGKAALDVRYWSVRAPWGLEQWPEIGLRYGVNSRWTTELLASFIGDTIDQQKLSSWNWQNEILLTQGQYAFDLGLHVQLIHSRDDGDSLEWGPVLQTEWGHTQLNANLFLEHNRAGGPAQLKLQWQLLQRLAPGWRLGVQGFGELG
ncbi:MAG TPA: hypothetical protein VGE47_10160, partial [Burkholderiaceae bacterium]